MRSTQFVELYRSDVYEILLTVDHGEMPGEICVEMTCI